METPLNKTFTQGKNTMRLAYFENNMLSIATTSHIKGMERTSVIVLNDQDIADMVDFLTEIQNSNQIPKLD